VAELLDALRASPVFRSFIGSLLRTIPTGLAPV
jgi:hypothetical protein